MRAYVPTLCILLLAMAIHQHLVLSKGLTLQQLQGVQGVVADSGDGVRVKHAIKAGKGPYGGANMNRDPRASKSNTPSSHLPLAFQFGFGFFMLLVFGF